MHLVRDWLQRYFSDPQVVGLAILLVAGFITVVLMGHMLAPALASLVIAYLLEGSVGCIERWRCPRWLAVTLVFVVFLAVLFSVIFGLLPLLSQQLTQFFKQLPTMIIRGQELLLGLHEHYPYLFSEAQVKELISAMRSELAQLGQKALSLSLASVVSLITLAMYLIIMPILVFFFLKDKNRLINWFKKYLPQERKLATQVWHDVDFQISNYVRGKFLEFLIVWMVTFITFYFMNLQFSMLLSVLVGASVIVPYVGALVVTFPVTFVAYSQWGFTSDFAYLLTVYGIIHALDGNVLVPLLFSEVVDLHPVAIIIAILVFGGFWGFWGIFFAIPLATLVQAVLKTWPNLPP
ncbi:permease [Candidatus Nitrosoglobus terrae]|uniref:Permease n=1 Tax=Candidatus Nitrosoglobus terrae TaxID=1630141 RepID=A0A1Q2SMB5_9GAMM|nr:AI-2E family transporter [Candidatus Nitrosoglobus terrae]BAW80253.1 permease [Candidatus Nitrosoglobus terrae]